MGSIPVPGSLARRSLSLLAGALALNACALSHPIALFADAGDAAVITDAAVSTDAPDPTDTQDVLPARDVPSVDAVVAPDVVTPPDVVTANDVPDVVTPPDVVTANDVPDVVTPPDVVTANDVVTPPDVPAVQDVVITPDVPMCLAPSRVCGGACVDVRSSLAHCGACDSPCATRCADGLCQDVTHVAVGTAHSCAVLRTGRLRCWGTNAQGQVGNGDTANQFSPVPIPGLDVIDVSLGANHSCAVLRDGSVRCWGDNGNGRLGDGTNVDRLSPTAVTGLPRAATQVSSGDNFTCARLDDGTLRCWGQGNEGQLGDGANAERRTPVAVSGLTAVRAVSAGRDFACAVLQNGLAWCWGHNDHGQVGDGTNTQAFLRPVAVLGLTSVRSIAAADDHACALREDGTAWCWGENNARQLGDGTNMARNRPVMVLGLDDARADALACGGDQCCVALADGAVRCWGDNASGQLGDNTTTDRDRATPVSGLLGVSALSTRGTGHTCALGSGVLHCWGLNDGGQLGLGSTNSQRLPVPLPL